MLLTHTAAPVRLWQIDGHTLVIKTQELHSKKVEESSSLVITLLLHKYFSTYCYILGLAERIMSGCSMSNPYNECRTERKYSLLKPWDPLVQSARAMCYCSLPRDTIEIIPALYNKSDHSFSFSCRHLKGPYSRFSFTGKCAEQSKARYLQLGPTFK